METLIISLQNVVWWYLTVLHGQASNNLLVDIIRLSAVKIYLVAGTATV